jgi:hypothetical protein
VGARRTGVSVQLLRRLLSTIRSRPRGHFALAFVAITNQLSVVSLAAAPTVLSVPALHAVRSACEIESSCAPQAQLEDSGLSLPTGRGQCLDSGPAAACDAAASPGDTAPGTPSSPSALAPCAPDPDKVLPATPAACSDPPLPVIAAARGGAEASPVVMPSVPVESLGQQAPARISLGSDNETLSGGMQAVLTATASSTVSGTNLAIEIFDETSRTLIGACPQGSQCSVAYVAASGVHDFTAFVTPPTAQIPSSAIALASNRVSVGWLDSTITASTSIAGQGQGVLLTATSTIDVRQSGRRLEIYDVTAGARLTYCSQGTVCTTTMKQAAGSTHEIVGRVTGTPDAVSHPVQVTWLGVSLAATSIGPKTGGTVYLKATINADLSATPWVVGVYDQQGHLVDHACKTGMTCTVQAWMSGGTTPSYTAVIGALPSTNSAPTLIGKVLHAAGAPTPLGMVDIQAKSAAIQPAHVLWGVDSCKAFTGDPTGQELYPAVVGALGTPDFWGRYLTNTVCPGISSGEIALAARNHMGILPIYNDYNCSNVSSYETGHGYADEAAAAAQNLEIPKGRVLVIDIEPYGPACPGAGNVDSGFIEGWYDGIRTAGYIPGYYGNGTNGTEFAAAWCATVSRLPNVALGSHLWSFEPSLLGNFSKSAAPDYSPFDTGCAGNTTAWQYVLSYNTHLDVDQDEALSSLPLWYPN